MNPKNASLDARGICLLLLLCASWGLNQVAIKVAIDSIPPIMQGGLRSIGAAILVFLWMKIRGIPVFNKDHTLFWGLLVGFLFSVEFILIYWGLEFTYASRAVIFINTAPFVVALGAHMFIPGETLTPIRTAGLVIAFAGIVFAFQDAWHLPSRQVLMGDLMLIVAAVFWGATTVIIKASSMALIPPGKTLLYQLGVSAVLMPLASIALNEPQIQNITMIGMISMFYQTVWVAFITYIAWFWLIRNYSAPRLSSFTFFTPLFGVAAGALLLNEPLSLALLFSLFLVSSGIYLVNRKY